MERRLRDITQLNILRYEQLLATEVNPKRREIIRELLREGESEAELFREQAALEREDRKGQGLWNDAPRLRERAKEFRAKADQMTGDAARGSFLHLAHSFERLADSAERLSRIEGCAGGDYASESTHE